MIKYNIITGVTKVKAKLAIAATSLALIGGGAGLSLGVFGTAHAAVGGPVCNVPTDYSTIQAAVSDPGCATVKVAAGTYHENVNVTRSVNIKGAKANDSVSGRTAAAVDESTVTGVTDTPAFTVNASNVTIDGFSITNPNHGLGITVKTAGNNAIIRYSILDNIGNVAYPDNTVGVYLENGPDGVRVAHNRISHIQSVKSAQGALIGDSTANDPSLDIRFVDNSISDITSTKGAYGIQANNAKFTTVKILDNSINNLTGKWDHAIGLEGKTPNAVVKNNTISNLNGTTLDKVAVWFEDNLFFFTADVNRNNLNVGSNAFGIAVHPALVSAFPSLNVNGTCNYWGAANGPGAIASGSGSMVGTGVDYTPWLKHSNLHSDCSGGQKHDKDNHEGDNDNFNRFFQEN